MFRRFTLMAAIASAALLGGVSSVAAQSSIFMRPDGNGYFYYDGPGAYRTVPAYPSYGYSDHDRLHGELQYRDYQRSQIGDTAARYGQLTPYQREVLRRQLTNSADRDGAYHQGYHRGEAAGYGQGFYNGWGPYRPGYGGYGGPIYELR
jgi:hypothetical protein